MNRNLGRRLVALDVGSRRVGVAVSDELGMIASPVESVDMKSGGMRALKSIIASFDPSMIVVGLPRNMSGREGAQAKAVRAFAKELATEIEVPITFWDERLTTFAAEQALIAGGRRREERKKRIDAVAAALILQSYLDSLKR